MPAGSDGAVPALPRTWRPLGPRIAAAAGGGALLAVTALLWIGFDEETKQAVTPFQRITVVAMFALALGCLHAIGRSRVEARETGLVVVNGYRRHELAWAEVLGVRLTQGAPWVTLDLSDGTTVPAMGIQSSDGGRARTAVRDLRVLVDHAVADGAGGDTGDGAVDDGG